VEEIGHGTVPYFSGVVSRKEDKPMVPILVILTVIVCIAVRSIVKSVRRVFAGEERKTRRSPWILTEEAFSKC
jgi:hypothetical protein